MAEPPVIACGPQLKFWLCRCLHRRAMTIEIADRTVAEPTAEEVASSVAALDGKHKHTVVLRHPNGVMLRLSRKRSPGFIAELLKSDGAVTVSKHSEKLLTQEQAIRAAQAFAEGREDWPRLMKWQHDVEATPQERRRALAEERSRPLLKRVGTVLFIAILTWGFLLWMEGGSRGLGGLLLGRNAPLFHKAVLDGIVALCMSVGLELWMLMKLNEDY